MDAGARRGKNGPILHWEVPKLELLQSVVPDIKSNGVPSQWSADFTEHAHISLVKEPARAGNNHGYEPQICRYLDRLEKIRNFDLATAIIASGFKFGPAAQSVDSDSDGGLDSDEEGPTDFRISTTAELLPVISTFGYNPSASRPITDYFYRAKLVKNGLLPSEVPP